jgi:hypothetical protein
MTGIYWNVNWTKCEINMGYHFGDRCNTMPKHIRILGVVRIQNLFFFSWVGRIGYRNIHGLDPQAE